MTAANSFRPELLLPALAATRKAMARLDEDDLPARVRVVAKRAGKLPPPLAKSLLTELDRNPWLRELALDELAPDELAEGPGSASDEFLRRESGWEERLGLLVEAEEQKLEEKSVRRLESELQKAKAEIESLKRRLRLVEKEQAKVVPRETPARTPRVEDNLKAALSSKEKALASSEAARQELMEQVARLQERNAALLRRRPDKSFPRQPPASGMRRGPLQLAQDLDARLKALTIPPVDMKPAPVGEEAESPQRPSMPAGIRPDTSAAIDWLVSYRGPLTVAVDGWNLAFQFKNPPGKKERAQVESAVGRLSHQAGGSRRLMVLFDSRFDLSGNHPGTHPQVEVRFPASADEALIELARELTPLVVISSDRRVREEASRSGAIGLWGEALVDWLR